MYYKNEISDWQNVGELIFLVATKSTAGNKIPWAQKTFFP